MLNPQPWVWNHDNSTEKNQNKLWNLILNQLSVEIEKIE